VQEDDAQPPCCGGYPTTAENTKVPYVMFPNTPYAHLMIPIK